MTVLVSHWQPPPPRPEGPACRPALLTRKDGPPFTLTILRPDVTCDPCKQTPAWKAGILAIRVVADPPRKATP